MAYKKFELEDPKNHAFNSYMRASPVLPNRPVADPMRGAGLTLKTRPYNFIGLRIATNPEQYKRAPDIPPKYSDLMFGLAKGQLLAAHVKFLSREGWTTKRIIEKISVTPATIYNIVARRTHKEVKPLKPDWFEKNT